MYLCLLPEGRITYNLIIAPTGDNGQSWKTKGRGLQLAHRGRVCYNRPSVGAQPHEAWGRRAPVRAHKSR